MESFLKNVCAEAWEEKVAIEVARDEKIAERIGQMLAIAVQKGEKSNEALSAFAYALARDAEYAICAEECDEPCGRHADNLLTLVTEAAENGKIAGVGVEGDKLTILNAK
ncbi:MAG: hypothetical protein IKZ87_08645 [Actinomycetaceae bacterium]|nr:hypothetical protein [Actinomycetaceae bacterium]